MSPVGHLPSESHFRELPTLHFLHSSIIWVTLMLKFFSTIALVSTKNNILLLSTTPSSFSFSFSSSWGPSPIAKHYYPSFSFSKFFSTSTAFDKQSFTISYLINSCGFSPQTASNVSQTITLSNSQKPDSVIAFFTTHGFSYSQIRLILTRKPKLLLCKDPNKLLLPKFQFLLFWYCSYCQC